MSRTANEATDPVPSNWAQGFTKGATGKMKKEGTVDNVCVSKRPKPLPSLILTGKDLPEGEWFSVGGSNNEDVPRYLRLEFVAQFQRVYSEKHKRCFYVKGDEYLKRKKENRHAEEYAYTSIRPRLTSIAGYNWPKYDEVLGTDSKFEIRKRRCPTK